MSQALSDLDSRFLPKAEKLLAALEAAGIHVQIITTRRTAEAQADARAHGVSWTNYSPHQDGMAIDVAPPELMKIKNWAPEHPLWKQIGVVGCSLGLGLVWGGTWRRDAGLPYARHYDPGHFQDGDWKHVG